MSQERLCRLGRQNIYGADTTTTTTNNNDNNNNNDTTNNDNTSKDYIFWGSSGTLVPGRPAKYLWSPRRYFPHGRLVAPENSTPTPSPQWEGLSEVSAFRGFLLGKGFRV